MHEIGVDIRRVEVDAAADRTKSGFQRFRTSETPGVEFVARDFESLAFEILIAEATNFDIDRFCQLAREITNVNTGAAVNVRRIFVGQEEDLHDLFVVAQQDFSKRRP